MRWAPVSAPRPGRLGPENHVIQAAAAEAEEERRRKGARKWPSAAAARPGGRCGPAGPHTPAPVGGWEETRRRRRRSRSYSAAYALVRWRVEYRDQTMIPQSLHRWQQHNRLAAAVSLAAPATHRRRNLLIFAALALAMSCPPLGLIFMKESISLPVGCDRFKLVLGSRNPQLFHPTFTDMRPCPSSSIKTYWKIPSPRPLKFG